MFFVSLLLSCIHLRHSIVHSVLSTGTHSSNRTVMYPLCLIFTLAFFLLAFLGTTARFPMLVNRTEAAGIRT